MTKPLLIVLAAGLLVAGSVFAYWGRSHSAATGSVTCTMEAKQCPDGTYVGRSGPQCQFAPCPSVSSAPSQTKNTGLVKGTVSLVSTMCPGASGPAGIPPCPRQGYLARIIAAPRPNGMQHETETDAGGNFSLALPPGAYLIQVQGSASGSPRCDSQTVAVRAGETVAVALSCDPNIKK